MSINEPPETLSAYVCLCHCMISSLMLFFIFFQLGFFQEYYYYTFWIRLGMNSWLIRFGPSNHVTISVEVDCCSSYGHLFILISHQDPVPRYQESPLTTSSWPHGGESYSLQRCVFYSPSKQGQQQNITCREKFMIFNVTNYDTKLVYESQCALNIWSTFSESKCGKYRNI